MIEFNQLEHLIAIEKAGTLSKAAESLHISQPGLTRSIQRLEDDLGMPLFEHKKNKLILNENGLLALQYAKKIISARQEMITEMERFANKYKKIKINSLAPAPLWGCTYLLKYQHLYQQVEKGLYSNENELIQELKSNNTDFIILTHPLDDYLSYPLFEEQLYLSVPPAHPLALYDSITFQDIDGQSILLLNQIGFWNEICRNNIPHSHLLYQDDPTILHELTNQSSLPNFKSNITVQNDDQKKTRKYLPITSKEAFVEYYLITTKEYASLGKTLAQEIKTIDWEKAISQQ